VTKIAQDGAQYSVLCNEAGGVLDDLFTYRLGHDRFLTVTNAANHEKDLAWFQKHAAEFDVHTHDRISDYAMLAIQGPNARALVTSIADQELPKRFRTASLKVAGVDALVAGTGYTGEDGVEILTAPSNAAAIWDAATQHGAQPAGLGARDTLRLEVCFHLYGNDLSEDRGPIEAGLGWCCKEDTNFVGSEPVKNARENGTPEKLVPFALTGPGIARQGNPINGGGVVTSGTLSPCLDIGIGMAYLPAEKAVPGTPFDIDVRGKTRVAEVRTKPLYSKES
jgi:aminomethyltransferase